MNYLTKTREELIQVVEEQKQELDSLKALLKKEITEKNHYEFLFDERSKEIKCNNLLSRILSNPFHSIDDVCDQIVAIIPPAWKFPEQTCAAIMLNDKVYKSSNFKKSDRFLSEPIKIGDDIVGNINVYYHGKDETASIFLPEEYELLFTIASRFGKYLGVNITEKAAHESESKYRNLIENINDVVYEIDATGIIKYISPPIERIIGYEPEEIIGKNFLDFVGVNAEFLKQRLNRLHDEPEIKRDYKIRAKSGEDRWIRFSTKAIFENQKLVGATGTLIDVTSNKQIELELQKSESLYRSIMHASPDAMTITDLNGVVQFSSPTTQKMFGADSSDVLVNRPLFDFLDQKSQVKAAEAIADMQKGKFRGAEEYVGLKIDGTPFYIEVNGDFIYDGDGNPTGLVFVTRDISERKATENELRKSRTKYQKLVESINDVVFDVALDGTIKYISPSIEKITNLKPEDTIGQNFLKFVHPDDRELVLDIFRNDRFNELKTKEYRYLIDDKIVWVQVSSQYTYEDDQIVGRAGILHDITEQKLAEEKLRKSEEKYRRLVESVNDVIYEIDASGSIRFVSQSVINVLGYAVEDVIDRNIFSFIYPEDVPAIMNSLKNLSYKNYSFLEYRYIRKDGSVRWVRSSTTPTIVDGEMIGATGILTDVTERKAAEEKLLKSEETYRNLVETINDVIYEIDLEGNVKYVSPAIRKITGYSAEELTSTNIFKIIHPDDLQELIKRLRVKELKELPYLDFRFIHRNGEISWTRSYPSMVVKNEEVVGRKGILTDITRSKIAEIELKESEELYHSIISASPDSIFITDLEGRIVFVSPQGKKMYNSDLDEDFINHSAVELIAPEDHEKIQANIVRLLDEPLGSIEYKSVRKDGTLFDVEINAETIKDAYGKPIKILAVIRDISERKKMEQELRRSEESFRHMVENINDVVYEVGAEGTVNYVSPSIERFLGYKSEELIGQNFFNYMHEDDRPAIVQRLKTLDQRNYSFLEYRYYSKNKEVKWVRSSTNPYFVDGKMIGGRGVLIDITEQKEAEEKLKQSEARYKTFFEGNNSVMLLLDPGSGSVKDANPAACKYYGWSREEICGLNISDINTLTKDEIDREMQLAIERRRQHFIFKHRVNSGEIRDVEVYSGPIQFGESQLLYSIVHDITDRRKAEEQIRKLSQAIEQSPVSVVITNLDGNIEYANPKACETTGYTLNELIGQNPRVLKSGETEKDEYQYLWDSISHGNIWRGIFHNKRKNGELYWEASQISPIIDETGGIVGYLAIKEDITERKRVQEELAKSENRFRQVAEQTLSVIWETNETGLYTYVSPVAKLVWGYDPEELINQKYFYDLHPQEGRKEFKEVALKIFKHHGVFKEVINPIVTKNKTIIWVSTSGEPILDQQNKLIGYRGADNDITARKLAEEALMQREIDLNYAQEIANMGSWTLDLKNNKLDWSKNYYRMLGLQPNEKGISDDHFTKMIHPDDIHLLDETLQQIHSTEKEASFDLRLVMPDQTIKWVQNNIVPVFENGQLVKLQGVNIDITEKKQTEEKIRYQNDRLNAILTAIPDLIFINDKEGNYLEFFISDSEKLLINPDQIIGQNMKNLFELNQANFFIQKINEALDQKKTVSFDYSIHLPNSESENFEARIVPLGTDKVLILARDITEKTRKEAEIMRLSLAVEQSPVSIVITDLSANIEYVNPAFEQITGYSAKEVVGKNTNVLKSGKTPPNTYKNMWETIEKGEKWHGEWVNKKKNGELFWEYVSITPIHDAEGTIVNYLAIKQDITERKHTEEILRQNEEKYRYMFVNNPQPMWIYDLETLAFLEVNGAAINHYGYSRDEFLSMTLKDIRPKEDIALLLEDIKNTNKSYSSGSEWHHLKKNGELIDVEIIAHPVVFSNREARHVLVNDITKRKKAETEIRELNSNLESIVEERTKALANSEKSYRRVVENIAEVVFQTDADGLWIFLNKSWEEITGFTVKESIGQLFVNYVYPDDRERNWKLFEPLIQRKKDYCRHEIRYLTKDGGFRWIEVYARLGLNEQNEIVGTYGTLQDITVRKEAEEMSRIQKERLESIIEGSSLGTWEWNVKTGETIFNSRWAELIGYSLEELYPFSIDTWNKYCHPDDLALSEKLLQKHFDGESEYYACETRMKHKDGSWVWVYDSGKVISRTEEGKPLWMFGSHHDITERKRAEIFENELLQLSPKLTGIPLSEMNSAINLALSRIGTVLEADRSYIFEFSSDLEFMNNTFEWCNDSIAPEIQNLQDVPCELLPAWMGELKQLHNILIDSVVDLPENWSAERAILEPQGIQSLIVIPMVVENSLIGFVGLDSVKNKKSYSTTEINILKIWSSMLSSLINNQRNEKLVEQTRQNYETFFNTIDDFLWVLDQQGNIIHTNDTVKNRLEYQADELLNQSVLQVHLPDRREEAGRIVGEMLTGTAEFCPVPIVTKSGNPIPVETRVKSGFWNGRPVIFGVSKDISQVQLSEQKFSSAFQSNSAMMSISNFSSGIFIDVNVAFIDALGYTQLEIIGKTSAELGLFVYAEDRNHIIEDLNQNIPIRKMEVMLKTKDGTIKTGLLSADPIFIGETRCLLTVVVDITERKRAEEQLQWNKTLLEMMSNSSPLGFLVVDNRTDEILYFNKRFCQIWGIEQLEEQMLRGELKNNDIIPYCLPVLVDIPAFAESCKPLQDENNRTVLADEIPFSNNRTIHRYTTQIRGKDDQYFGRFYIFEDISEEKLVKQELMDARNEAEQANMAKSEFLSRMSHELRTPMNSILGFAQLLEMGELNTGQRKGVNHIMKSGKHLLDLINEVLDISRIESGRLSLSLEPVQLSTLIPEMTDVIRHQATDRKITVRLIDSPDNALFVRADRQRLKQVLLNLLNNAVKYNKDGGSITIKVELKALERIRISVIDTGQGIPEEFLPKLFTPFERIGADKTTTEGTGLGLSVVKKLMEAMGGLFGVDSVWGEGSSFWIELPRDESQIEKVLKSGNLEQCATKISGKTGTILYIEDNRSNVELVEQILSNQRADIELITDIHGKKAIPLAIKHQPDLILLDLNLPDIHGSVVLQELQSVKDLKDIPVVVISADAMPQQLNKLLKAGAKNYLTKPLNIPEFLKMINNFLPG